MNEVVGSRPKRFIARGAGRQPTRQLPRRVRSILRKRYRLCCSTWGAPPPGTLLSLSIRLPSIQKRRRIRSRIANRGGGCGGRDPEGLPRRGGAFGSGALEGGWEPDVQGAGEAWQPTEGAGSLVEPHTGDSPGDKSHLQSLWADCTVRGSRRCGWKSRWGRGDKSGPYVMGIVP